jgi:hypothetical protein
MIVFIRHLIEGVVLELRSSYHNYFERNLVLVLTYAATFSGSEF